MKPEETRVLEKTYGEDAAPALAGRSLKLEVSIKAVKIRDLPELDDELAQDVSDELKTLDDLRKKVKKDLKERASGKIRAITINNLTDKLVEVRKSMFPNP